MVSEGVTLRFTHAILQAAERRGIVLPPAVRDAIPSDGRTPMSVQDDLWEAFCRSVDDPLIGIRLGRDLQVGHLDLVGMLLMSCETQGEALDLLLEYHPVVGEGGDFHLAHEGDDCLLVYEPHFTMRRRERVESVLACTLNLARWITGGQFEARRIQFATPAGGSVAAYETLLNTPVRFDAPSNALVFAPALQATPLIQANTVIRDHLRTLADQALAAIDRSTLGSQVQALIRQEPRWGKERIAEQLGMSGRHLVRRLQDEGTTFKVLRSTLMQGLAKEALSNGASVSDVAADLGFSDESAFNKAFKRWTGQTPARFRTSRSDQSTDRASQDAPPRAP